MSYRTPTLVVDFARDRTPEHIVPLLGVVIAIRLGFFIDVIIYLAQQVSPFIEPCLRGFLQFDLEPPRQLLNRCSGQIPPARPMTEP